MGIIFIVLEMDHIFASANIEVFSTSISAITFANAGEDIFVCSSESIARGTD